jgi:hypothetical protein
MDNPRSLDELREVASSAPVAGEAAQEPPPAWEQIEDGRYMPRRVRGSCLGRELG